MTAWRNIKSVLSMIFWIGATIWAVQIMVHDIQHKGHGSYACGAGFHVETPGEAWGDTAPSCVSDR